jgi:hypothetical protein
VILKKLEENSASIQQGGEFHSASAGLDMGANFKADSILSPMTTDPGAALSPTTTDLEVDLFVLAMVTCGREPMSVHHVSTTETNVDTSLGSSTPVHIDGCSSLAHDESSRSSDVTCSRPRENLKIIVKPWAVTHGGRQWMLSMMRS